MHVVSGAGAYICGEETALLESLEGRKGYPRLKPPFPANAGGGLFKQPTAVNNVETLANLPAIINLGGDAFNAVGLVPKNGGTRLFAVSGHSRKTGVFEAPMGITFKALLDDYCGGMRPGSTLKAIIPGGSSSAIMTAAEADWASDFDTLKAKKTMAGSGAVVYLDQSVNIAHALANVMRFYSHESCGQCTPCREGTAWLSRLMDKIVAGKGEKTDVDNVHQIARQMEMKTICALADGAAMPAKSYIEKFRADFDALVRG
jgi:NADH-quinone oxidoreductase subunit F